jgi:hypothetical protein
VAEQKALTLVWQCRGETESIRTNDPSKQVDHSLSFARLS